jgi:hypothetical protein
VARIARRAASPDRRLVYDGNVSTGLLREVSGAHADDTAADDEHVSLIWESVVVGCA